MSILCSHTIHSSVHTLVIIYDASSIAIYDACIINRTLLSLCLFVLHKFYHNNNDFMYLAAIGRVRVAVNGCKVIGFFIRVRQAVDAGDVKEFLPRSFHGVCRCSVARAAAAAR